MEEKEKVVRWIMKVSYITIFLCLLALVLPGLPKDVASVVVVVLLVVTILNLIVYVALNGPRETVTLGYRISKGASPILSWGNLVILTVLIYSESIRASPDNVKYASTFILIYLFSLTMFLWSFIGLLLQKEGKKSGSEVSKK